ncbi:MAG: integrase, partial [Ignavibacteria bacterium]
VTALDPVAAIQGWLDHAEITDGPVFRPVDRHGNVRSDRLTGQSVALILKRLARRAGLDESRLAGHSLRTGIIPITIIH